MWTYQECYDVLVVGGGHAGIEAALAAARMGARALLLTSNLDTIAKLSCNPAIGGTAKGQLVREIDALGGAMGTVADQTGIQFRMLNRARGPAVWAPRAQVDKQAYPRAMKHLLEKQPHLSLLQGTIEDLEVAQGKIAAVRTKEGLRIPCRSLVISSGTFLRGLMHLGETSLAGGRAGDAPSVGLSKRLIDLGFVLGRLKTGTPPRLHAKSIDFSLTEEQPGEESVFFSYFGKKEHPMRQVPCHITYTTAETKQVVQESLHLSPMYSGKIESVGPRYCPSIEDKIARFHDKERHQIFLEPEGLHTEEIYANGISTCLPIAVQMEMLKSIPALKRAKILRPGYAIEYDYIASGQLTSALECRWIEGLFFAGQVNGTTGYEEAAAQGLVAGVNAVLRVREGEPFLLKRSDAYIGVLIDDLITKPLKEPYRMFTSRAEFRLLLRQDNADLRLTAKGRAYGLVSEEHLAQVERKRERVERATQALSKKFVQGGHSLWQLLIRPESSYRMLIEEHGAEDLGEEINQQIEVQAKYSGYIQRQEEEVRRLKKVEGVAIPKDFDFALISSLGNEARELLSQQKPETLGQASRIQGLTPADILQLSLLIDAHASSP